MSYLSIVAAASLVSSMARFMPMQLRRPSEKGMKTSWSLHRISMSEYVEHDVNSTCVQSNAMVYLL